MGWYVKNRKTKRLGAAISRQLMEQAEGAGDDALFIPAGFSERAAERTSYSNYSYWRSTLNVFWKNKLARVLVFFLLALVVFILVQPFLPGQRDPVLINNDESGMHIRNRGPDSEFWFGTNSIGQDLWARVWAGTRTSMLISIIVVFCNMVLGIAMGVVWGYVRKLDRLMTEFYNIVDNIPRTIILIMVSYILRPGLTTIILSMILVGWLETALMIRNQVVILRDRDYILVSRCLGTPAFRIILRNLLPYLVSVVMLQMAISIPSVIGDEVFLTYCGLGVPINVPSLGNLINAGRSQMMSRTLRYQLIFPAIVVSAITISFYVVGNAFSDAADPKNHV